MKTEIITIGDEILIGQIVDTNSAWMARELNKEGFSVAQITSVSDNGNHIKEALDNALSRTDIVLVTGGLGPTKDDLTLQTLSEYFDTKLVFSEDVFNHIKSILSRSNLNMNELNQDQALVPENATVINNEAGTAPITWFEKNGKIVVSMPGVPLEMQWVMKAEIIPRLKNKFKTNSIIHKHFLVYGYPESTLSLKLEEFENDLPDYVKLAYLPSIGIIRLRLSGTHDDKNALQKLMDEESRKLNRILGSAILTNEDIPIEVLIGNLLKEKGMTLSTAESCTGGNIAHMITSVPGSSDYYKGSIVAYDNTIKEDVLEVSAEDIEEYGVVSLPVVEQMAKGALYMFDTDIAVATSGIAGPTGATEDKSVGTVCIAVATRSAVISRQFVFGKQRDKNIIRSSIAALAMLKKAIC